MASSIFPVPPFQQVRIVLIIPGIIAGAGKNIKEPSALF